MSLHGICLQLYCLTCPSWESRRLSACDCPASFTGPHCEYVRSASDGREANADSSDNSTSSGDSFMKDRLVANIIMLTICSLGFMWVVREAVRKYIAKRRQQEAVVLNLQSFREENQGAVSANGSMLFPSAMNHQRSTSGGQFTMEELMHDVEIT